MNLLKFQTLWYLAFVTSLLWFLYWICYDIIVWNKPPVEVNLINFVGFILSLAFVFAGFRLRKVENVVGIFKKEKNEEQSKVDRDPSLIYTQQASSQTDDCPHHFGYLSQRSKGEGIPGECITCEKVIACISGKNDVSSQK